MDEVETNIVLVHGGGAGETADSFLAQLKKVGVLAVSLGPETVRFVTNYNVGVTDIDIVIQQVKQIFQQA